MASYIMVPSPHSKRGKDGESDLYRVEYDDGDAGDMDRDEYNFAYALELSDQGWVVEEGGGASEESVSEREGIRDTWKPSKVISKIMPGSMFFLLSCYFCVWGIFQPVKGLL